MSYDFYRQAIYILLPIEGSPDHWWVTTIETQENIGLAILKGHQIIGELRLTTLINNQSHWNWRVTRSLVSYDVAIAIIANPMFYWRVTRSLVSYDLSKESINFLASLLKGHQIIGELRLLFVFFWIMYWLIEGSPDHWWVTTIHEHNSFRKIIEGSPDHWWVTTYWLNSLSYINNWRVTRSLVSYDGFKTFKHNVTQIEGSPDHWWVTTLFTVAW